MRPDVHFAATADDATRNAITASKQLTFSDLARMLHAMRDAHHKIAWLEEFENGRCRGNVQCNNMGGCTVVPVQGGMLICNTPAIIIRPVCSGLP